MTWTAPAPQPEAVAEILVGPDRPMLEAYLDWQRATLRNICAGLTAEQLASRPIASTNLSLLGLVRHMAKVERFWFRQRVAGHDFAPMYDPSAGKDADFEDGTAADASPAIDRLDAECRAARAAAAGRSFDVTVEHHGNPMSLRMVYVHMIGEYARHNGHADLLREAIDGSTGR